MNNIILPEMKTYKSIFFCHKLNNFSIITNCVFVLQNQYDLEKE